MIRRCVRNDFSAIEAIINNAAVVYRGIIPDDCWHEPYMLPSYLKSEIESGVEFWGWEEAGNLVGVMGVQNVKDVTLIRHAYISPQHQNNGIGKKLLDSLLAQTERYVLVGAWAAANWAIRFYEKNGFHLVSSQEKKSFLDRYWTVSQRQVETSVVLAYNTAASAASKAMDHLNSYQKT